MRTKDSRAVLRGLGRSNAPRLPGALHRRKRAYFDHGVKISTKDLSAAIPALKKEEGTAWLSRVSSVPLQQALRHLDAAYTNFFEGRAEYPTFKKKHGEQSATYTDNAFTLHGDKLTLAKHKEPLDIVWSRSLPDGAKPSSVTVSKDKIGRYFVSILIEEEIAPLAQTEKTIGIDLGLKSFQARPAHYEQPDVLPQFAQR